MTLRDGSRAILCGHGADTEKMAQELGDAFVAAIAPPSDGKPYVIVYDGGHKNAVAGFGMRVTKAGARSFVLNYRVRGSGVERRYTIGSWPGWKTHAARGRARELRKIVDQGGDPMGKLTAERDAPTVNDLAARYLEEHAAGKRERSRKEDESLLNQIIKPELGSRKVADLQHDDIARLHRKVGQKGIAAAAKVGGERPEPRPAPVRANRAVALLNKMFNLAILWKIRADNPAKGLKRNHEERRERYLSGEELVGLTAELAKHENQASANIVRLLLLTGARRGEVLNATWSQFDIGRGIWIKPSSHTKQKREHRIPLSAAAMQLLSVMQEKAEAAAKAENREASMMLFPGRGTNDAQTDLKTFWATVCKRAKIRGVRVHDLRHTYASILASAGLSLPIIGQLLGHTQPATTARYTHLFDDPLRQATERVGAIVEAASAERTSDVVPLRKPKRR